MTEGKARRQRAIEELLRTANLTSQEDLAERLADLGYAVTQATVSRDLDELGAVKVRTGGGTRYSMPDQIGDAGWAGRRLETIVREWVRSIDSAGNFVVIKTPPGSAHLVGLALDQAELPGVVGTICGDDTIFVAVGDSADPGALASRLRLILEG
jgi:transcriptional regulator of arginine metabolism